MAHTMLDAAKLERDVLKKNVVGVFAESSPVLELMPFMDIPGGAYKFNREETLPGVGFRGINEDYSESTGVLQQLVETTSVLGGKSKTDRALAAERGGSIGELRAINDRLSAKSAALYFTKMFFDGDNDSDPRQFDGLNKRLVGSQVIEAGEEGAGLTVAMLDDLIDSVVGEPDVLFMSKAMRREVTKLLRNDGRVAYDHDAFGHQVTTYGGIPIRVIEEDEQGQSILGFDEEQGESDECGSIYAVRFGAEEFVHGIQNGPLDVLDMGLQEGMYYLTAIEWLSSFVILHPKAAARLKGITRSE